ncbi:helix-turn-helix domain-containing protein [Mycobacterium sp. CVI_P3]|uniref:Helix-turn-helix domain-containing protein n=1 Tax=Mycobacterium pinniadriaticum TaxID=2994102 RepID=A0ABT3SCA7_9MYCO|nr:helix-turn-helix domain-containing protein [Mycobacterium pinniadriaticum]MCX2930737.1 helix-turn-helix domain-containing protein [Mycobacterium pinniadriaticum]MCX2937161.1 helix-turn-helix domain-containing protein [Mycobacterium pinniadriaticum]
MREAGVGLGQLLLALDAAMVCLVEAPRGLDREVRSAALIDADDVRLGLSVGAGSADVFFLLGISDADAIRWLDRQIAAHGPPAAVFVKEPSDAVVARAAAAGTAVVAVDPKARWERLYRLVNHVFEHRRTDSVTDTGTDLFALAQSIADRTHGMVSIEDAQSHVLAYSASNEEADELRRLSILGRAGPAEHLRWIAQWGIFDRLRAGTDVVTVEERPELGLRPRLAIGIHRQDPGRETFAGTIWVQQGSRPLADDAEDVLRGAAVLAARIIARLAARPSAHLLAVQQLLGLAEADGTEITALARELGVIPDGRAAVIGFATTDAHPRTADVLALSASAFRPDAQVAANGSRVYVVLPDSGRTAAVVSWIRGTIASLHTELGLDLRAVIAAPIGGLAAVAGARREIDRVFDSAQRHPVFGQVTTLAEARTTVLLDEIVTLVGADPRLVDPRIRRLRDAEPVLAETLQVYLDSFGDVAAAAATLHVHPNTVRYRVRRIEQMLSTSLADPDVRLLLSLSLRATA